MDTSYRENYIVFVNPNQGRRTACCLRVLRRFPSSFFLRVFHDKGWYTRSVPLIARNFESKFCLITVSIFYSKLLQLACSIKKSPIKSFANVDGAIKSPERHRSTRPPSENFFVKFFSSWSDVNTGHITSAPLTLVWVQLEAIPLLWLLILKVSWG